MSGFKLFRRTTTIRCRPRPGIKPIIYETYVRNRWYSTAARGRWWRFQWRKGVSRHEYPQDLATARCRSRRKPSCFDASGGSFDPPDRIYIETRDSRYVFYETAASPWILTDPSITEIYDEALELLDSIQFSLKAISEGQWLLFDIIYNIFKTSGTDFISEMFPSLDNFITYGADAFAINPERRAKIFDIYLATITSKTLSCSDRIVACKLADSVLLCMKGRADEALPLFIDNTMHIIQRGITNVDPITTKPLYMHALEVILNTIYYNPNMAMDILIKNNWSADFFSGWFHRLPSFKRTHDKKLGLLAICSILSIGLNENAESILVQSSAQLLIGALTLFETLPNAIRSVYPIIFQSWWWIPHSSTHLKGSTQTAPLPP